jgi:hypothetical protein
MIRAIAMSGEGVTDLGVSRRNLAISEGADIEVGPALLLIYKLIHLYAPAWYRDMYDWTQEVPIPTYLVSRGERSRVTKTLKPNLFQTHANGRGGIEHAKGAWERPGVRGFLVGQVAPARCRRVFYVYQAITDRRAYQPYDAITA